MHLVRLCEQMASGASDAILLLKILEGGGTIPVNPGSRTDRRVIWVNPDTNARVNLSERADTVDGMDGNGDSVLDRLAPERMDLAEYVNGKWIDATTV